MPRQRGKGKEDLSCGFIPATKSADVPAKAVPSGSGIRTPPKKSAAAPSTPPASTTVVGDVVSPKRAAEKGDPGAGTPAKQDASIGQDVLMTEVSSSADVPAEGRVEPVGPDEPMTESANAPAQSAEETAKTVSFTEEQPAGAWRAEREAEEAAKRSEFEKNAAAALGKFFDEGRMRTMVNVGLLPSFYKVELAPVQAPGISVTEQEKSDVCRMTMQVVANRLSLPEGRFGNRMRDGTPCHRGGWTCESVLSQGRARSGADASGW